MSVCQREDGAGWAVEFVHNGAANRPTQFFDAEIWPAGQPAMHGATFDYYAPALKMAQAKGLTWSDENLLSYLADPKAFLNEFNGPEQRSAMKFQLKDEAEHKAAIEGLKIISACQ